MGRKGNRRRWKNSNPAFDHDRLRKEACDSRNQNLKLDEKIQLSEPVRIAESRTQNKNLLTGGLRNWLVRLDGPKCKLLLLRMNSSRRNILQCQYTNKIVYSQLI